MATSVAFKIVSNFVDEVMASSSVGAGVVDVVVGTGVVVIFVSAGVVDAVVVVFVGAGVNVPISSD